MNVINYKAAIYLRLSVENNVNEESDSIANQRKIIHDYISSHPEIQICDEMVDDGFSGSDSGRPGFVKLISEISNGSINCVIVKDLSRFSRDCVAAGNFIEKIFPSLGVRFISINDNIDSIEKSIDNTFMISIKNIINDAYNRDISIKTRSSLQTKRRKGEFINAMTTFGYLRSSDDRHKLIIDNEAAKAVRKIYLLSLCGVSGAGIANKLNALHIPSPYERKKQLGMTHDIGFKVNKTASWFARSVIRILQDDIYIGTLSQGKTTTPNHKINKIIEKPREEWDTIEDAHEPIISKNIFRIANKMHMADKRKAPNAEDIYIFAGLVFCADCKQSMNRVINKYGETTYHYYSCISKGCTGHRIKPDTLYDMLLDKINEYLNNLDNKDLFVKLINDEVNALSEDIEEIFVFDENREVKKLTRLLLVMLIDKIYVTQNKEILVEFNSFD